MHTGTRFNIKITSYQYSKFHCGDKTILRSSYLHNEIFHTGKNKGPGSYGYVLSDFIDIPQDAFPDNLYDNPQDRGTTLDDIGRLITLIYQYGWYNHDNTSEKHVCNFLGM